MDYQTILVKICGALLLAWTVRSIMVHLKSRKNPDLQKTDRQSGSERLLNGILLWAWLAFCIALGGGMIFNN